MMICSSCSGTGKTHGHINTGYESSNHYWGWVTCFHCNGTGQLNEEWVTEGKKLQEFRRSRNLTILEFSKELGVSPADLSGMEQGKKQPVWNKGE